MSAGMDYSESVIYWPQQVRGGSPPPPQQQHAAAEPDLLTNLYSILDKQESTMARVEDDFTWQPPSESELKVIEARRERNNKISSIMGQYLLKGYKMLAVTCAVCDCVLMEDRLKNKYCIGCLEVDADTKKDNPAVSEEAARRTVQEIQHRHGGEDQAHTSTMSSSSSVSCQMPASTQCIATSTTTTTACQKQCAKKALTIHGVDLSENAAEAVGVLRDNLAWATEQLSATTSIHEAQNLAGLITETCKAITALKELDTSFLDTMRNTSTL